MRGFNEFAVELFEGMGAVRARKMFGGAGLYLNDVMFGLIDKDTIYLKTDEALAHALIAEGSEPWVYEGNPKAKHTYYRLPLDALDEPDEAVRWGKRSYAAAVAQKKPKPKKRAKPKAK